MKIVYSRTKGLNFGDDLNLWLWPRLIPECLDENDGVALVGIGTIISKHIYNKHLAASKKIVVFGSGAGLKSVPVMDDQWKVYCVRGPITARKLHLPVEHAVADGAYLIRTLVPIARENRSRIAFIPHHRSQDYADWEAICQKAGISFLSPKMPVLQFLSEIQHCKKVITEAMHRAITADALRIPWTPVRFAPNFLEEKWLDFFGSIHLSPAIHSLPILYEKRQAAFRLMRNFTKNTLSKILPTRKKWTTLPVSAKLATEKDLDALVKTLQAIAFQADAALSKDTVVDGITEKLQNKLKALQNDYQSGEFFKKKGARP